MTDDSTLQPNTHDACTASDMQGNDSNAKDAEEKNSAKNHLRELRIENMMSKAELARKAGLSVLTITRIENGYGCRMDTKRKILKALGLKLAERKKVFEDD